MLMNRQLVAFLSMFSLVLVLSVYYVLMPGRTNGESAPVVNLVSDGDDPYFETILLEQEENHNLVIEEQYEIVSSSEYSNAEKAVALETIAKEQEIMKNEKQLRELIIATGYPTAYVELTNEDQAYVLTISETKTLYEVSEIIFIVQEFLNSDIDVQVSFR